MTFENSLWDEIQQGETKILEFKQQLPKGDQLAKTLVAFANTAGGKLIVGVNDQRQVVGIQGDEFDLMDQVASIVHDRCQPPLLPNIYLETLQNKTVLVIQVYRGNQLPYYLKSQGREQGVYIRLGATNRQAGVEMIQELQRQRVHQSFDEQIAWDVSLDQLDLMPLYDAFSQAGKVLDDAKMRNLKLIKTDQGQDYPTHGLLILLGFYDHVEIKCSRFKGTTMAVFLDKKEYSGDLFSQLNSTEAFIKNHLHLKVEILGLQRTEKYEIPMPAVREALINAVVHRDYSNFGRDIKIGIYDDALNIVSPGGFPNGVTLQDVLKGRSEIRNKVIARVLKTLGYIEQWGSGVARITEFCHQAGNPEPKLEESGDFVDWLFLRPMQDAVSDAKPDNVIDESSEKNKDSEKSSEKKFGEKKGSEKNLTILSYIAGNNKISAKAIAEKMGITSRAVEKHIAQLKKEGLLIRVGAAKGGYWQINDPNDAVWLWSK